MGTAARDDPTDPAGAAAGNDEFPCDACGAKLHYEPGASQLRCPYCDHVQPILRAGGPVLECDFATARTQAQRMRARELISAAQEFRCTGCGAISVTDKKSDRCAFCDSPVVLKDDDEEIFVPESLLPFAIDESEARAAFQRWLEGLWFAPSDLARRANNEGVDGVYLPYWTYDAHATTHYSGQRGDHYYVTETYTDADGKTQTRRVRKTRWTWTSGVVHDSFDDVLICASRSLPGWLVERLEPWDLHDLTGYDAAYLSGFSAERYGVDLEQGFDGAQARMAPEIRETVRRDIGGDEQRISRVSTAYDDVRFKHFLLPLWISSFRYRDEVYRFVVNARTGEPAGERPWSALKITIAVLGGIALIAAVVLLVSYLKG